jgi:hypothetical protein
MNDQKGFSQAQPTKTLPSWLIATGILLILGSVALAVRLIWEMTSLTWKYGPQMIGFSLAHGPWGALLFIFPIALCVWLLASLCTIIVWKVKHKRVLNRSWIVLGSAVLTLALLSLPQSFWNELFVGQLAKSPHAAELLVYAAGVEGNNKVVHGLLKRGVQVNATDREGNTALHFAASAGRSELVTYLIAQGADINAVNLYGDSPLERAIANHQTEVEQVLTSRGAKDLKGDAAQRDRASKAIVQRDIEEMNANRK